MILGLIGAGHIGTAVAKNAVRTGHEVVLSNSRGPETLTDLVAELGPKARAGTTAEAAAADVLVVTIPFGKERDLDPALFAGKIVIDTDNYYFERDGRFPEIDEGRQTVAGALQALLPDARIVRAFNQIYSETLAAGGDGTQTIPIAGDDAEAKQVVTDLIKSWGFDVVDAGPLAESALFDRDQPAYGFTGDAATLRAKLAEAVPNPFAG
jgi:8-hydroxy-5-deazaflavin:NADPH oxidoreductase